jgi:(2Fe-2S) ferredoxin
MAEWRSVSHNRKLDLNSEVTDDTDMQSNSEEHFYDVHIFHCTNERPATHKRGSCVAKGSKELCDYMCRRSMALGLKRIRVNHAGCLNRCELGPTMVIYPEGVWYTYKCEADIDEILKIHVMRGKRVERLMLKPDQGPRH